MTESDDIVNVTKHLAPVGFEYRVKLPGARAVALSAADAWTLYQQLGGLIGLAGVPPKR